MALLSGLGIYDHPCRSGVHVLSSPLLSSPEQTLSLLLLLALVWLLVCCALAGFVAVYLELHVSCTQLAQNASFNGLQDRTLCIPTHTLFSE